VIGGTSRLVAQLTAKLGSRFAVSTTATSALFDAIDPRSTRTVAIVVDLDATPVSTIAAIHSVFPELEITAIASDPVSAKAGRRAGATVVIAKPTSVDALSSAVRQLVAGRP
jgi:DNA-binding NarL/FixJ family response regulator